MKLHTELIALCDYAMISQEGKLSALGIFDIAGVQNFPGGIARAFLVSTVHGNPNTTYNLTLKVESEASKSPLNPLNLNVVTGTNGRNNLVIELVNLTFQESGNYSFVIYDKTEKVGLTTLQVVHVNQKQQPSPNKLN